jgi:hypothetical protein
MTTTFDRGTAATVATAAPSDQIRDKPAHSAQSTRVSVPSSKLGPFPTPPEASVSPPWTQRVEEQHSLASEGMGGPNSDDWNESQALCRYSVPRFIHSLTLTVQSNYSQRVPLMRPSSQFFTPYDAVT